MTLVVEALSVAHQPRLFALFEAADSQCYCRWFHFEGDKNDWLETVALRHEENRAWLAGELLAGRTSARGLVAVDEAGAIVGWLKLLSRDAADKVYRQRYYRGLAIATSAGAETAHLSCALVHPLARRRGVLARLIDGAVALAPTMGFSALVAFPRTTHRETMRDDELYTLPTEALLAAGFTAVEGDEPYPVLRRLVVTQ